MSSTHVAEPIDRLIRHYETVSCYCELIAKLQNAKRQMRLIPDTRDRFMELMDNGPSSHWKEFRRHLLGVHTEGFDYRKYVGAYLHEVSDSFGVRNYAEFMIAAWVASWTKSSRRIYSVPGDLQLLLSATTLEGVDWSAVRWPFDSFMIKLEYPLELDGREYDSILVAENFHSHLSTEQLKSIVLISKGMKTPESVFVSGQVDRVEKAIEKGNIEYAEEKLTAIAKNRMGGEHHLRMVYVPRDCLSDGKHMTELERVKYEHAISKTALRIVFGLLFYLQSIPPEKTNSQAWENDVFRRQDGPIKKITLPSEVCTISSVYTLNDAERVEFKKLLKGGMVEVSPHHREGYWRRPPGKGSDSSAKKTVWVRPTIVRMDKLADGGLPGGSEEIVT